jgi:transposase
MVSTKFISLKHAILINQIFALSVTTTSATKPDGDIMEDIHARLAKNKMLPGQHLVDKGYVHAEMLAKSQQIHQIDIIGPALPDTSWASKNTERFDHSEFSIDWESKSVTCPAGHKSRDWGNIPDRHGKPSLRIRFPLPACRPCPLHAQCTPIASKVLILRPDKQSYQALQENRKRQETPEFRALYVKRAGVEGTVAQAVRTCGIRRSRYIGQKKLNLQAFLTATTMNVLRACHWVTEEKHATASSSRFAKFVACVQHFSAA